MTRAESSGTLRRRALEAARRLVESRGAEALQLRAVATEVGSGVASLYYHFDSKDELLAAVAIEGCRELAEKIERARASGKFPNQIDAASAALLTFIRRHPHLYALMQTEPSLAGHAAVQEAGQRAFEAFQDAVHGDERVPAEHDEEVARLIWVLGRGIASVVQMEDDPATAERLVQTVLRGFGFLLSPRYAT